MPLLRKKCRTIILMLFGGDFDPHVYKCGFNFYNILDSDNCIFIFKKQKAKEKQIKLFKSFKSEATPTKQACMHDDTML